MPRAMAGLDAWFSKEVDTAIRLAKSAETALVQIRSGARTYHRPMHVTRVEYLYELAYLRMFISWEDFLEASFLRYLCGHQSPRFGRATRKAGTAYCKTLKAAEADMLAVKGWAYVRWGSTEIALQPVKGLLVGSRHQAVISGAKSRLNQFCDIRNRIAHGQPDAIKKFNAATMQLAHRTFDDRAGRFLRDFDTTVVPNVLWIESIGRALKAYASAIV